jgi:hypothetical protein
MGTWSRRMAAIRIILIVSILGLAGCATVPSSGYRIQRIGPSCPSGTYLVCEVDSARGCACGQLIVLN